MGEPSRTSVVELIFSHTSEISSFFHLSRAPVDTKLSHPLLTPLSLVSCLLWVGTQQVHLRYMCLSRFITRLHRLQACSMQLTRLLGRGKGGRRCEHAASLAHSVTTFSSTNLRTLSYLQNTRLPTSKRKQGGVPRPGDPHPCTTNTPKDGLLMRRSLSGWWHNHPLTLQVR